MSARGAARAKRPVSRVVFWEPCESPHKSDLFTRLAALAPDIEVICCAETALPEERRAQGWSLPAATGWRTVIAPDAAQIRALVDEGIDGTLHIFSGIRWVPSIVAALARVRRTGARFALLSEPRVREGWRGEVRFWQSWLTEGWLRRRAAFVLGIGRNGPIWFRSVGYPADRLFPFAYFVDAPMTPPPPAGPPADGAVRIGYLGRLAQSKGVHDLVAACAMLRIPFELAFAGDGPDRAALQAQLDAAGLSADFLGAIPLSRVGRFLADVDVLVLASTTKDGWGVAASEALLAGVPVVVSSHVGASIAVVHPQLGRVIDGGAPAQLAAAIEACATPPMRSSAMRAGRRAWARRVLDASSGARYLLAVLRWSEGRGPRPAPFHDAPWPEI